MLLMFRRQLVCRATVALEWLACRNQSDKSLQIVAMLYEIFGQYFQSGREGPVERDVVEGVDFVGFEEEGRDPTDEEIEAIDEWYATSEGGGSQEWIRLPVS